MPLLRYNPGTNEHLILIPREIVELSGFEKGDRLVVQSLKSGELHIKRLNKVARFHRKKKPLEDSKDNKSHNVGQKDSQESLVKVPEWFLLMPFDEKESVVEDLRKMYSISKDSGSYHFHVWDSALERARFYAEKGLLEDIGGGNFSFNARLASVLALWFEKNGFRGSPDSRD